MTDVIIYRQGNTVAVRDGAPPADQSAQVAQLTAALAAMTADRDAWRQRYEDATVPPIVQPAISGFAATPASITAGQSAVLNASVSGAVVLLLNGSPIPGLPLTVTPAQTMTYTLEATGAAGSTPATASLSITVAPVVVEPPPPAAGAENPLMVYDGAIGLTRDSVYLRIVNWRNSGGDWTDAEGAAQGAVPFGSARATKGQTAPVAVDATSLVQSFAAGEDVQMCLRASAIMSFRSRSYGGMGPALAVTYLDGTTGTLYAAADAECNMSTAYELGGNQALGLSYSNKAYVRFPAPARPVASAALVLTPNAINESGTVSLFRFAVHLDKLGIVEPYAPLTDCFVETEAFRKGTVPYPTYARIARESNVTPADAAWNQWAWVPVEGGGEALQITFDPRGSSALNSAIPFPGGAEADEVVWEFDIRMMPDLLTGARDGFKLFAGVSSKTKSDDTAFMHFAKAPESIGTFGTLLAGNGGSKAHGNDGWSLRWDSWNSPPRGHPMHGRFLPMQYAYHPEQIDYYGDPWSYSGQNTSMVVDKWHTVRQRCKINTVTHTGLGQVDVRKDAEFDGWLDGLPVLRKRDFRLRTTLWPLIGTPGTQGSAPYYGVQRTNLAIGRIWLNSYHGGTSSPLARCSFQVRNFRAKVLRYTQYVPPLGA